MESSKKKKERAQFETYYKAQHEAAHPLSDLRRYVVAELLQRCQEALQLAQLPGAASWRELLVRKRSRRRHGRPVAEAIGSGRSAVQGRRRVAASVQHYTDRTGTTRQFGVSGSTGSQLNQGKQRKKMIKFCTVFMGNNVHNCDMHAINNVGSLQLCVYVRTSACLFACVHVRSGRACSFSCLASATI